MNLTKSLKSLTNDILDYAGLFPPAGLPLKDAFANHLSYLESDFGFMLSKFISPVKQLSELLDLMKTGNSDKIRLDISLLLSGGKTIETFKENLETDLTLWNEFNLKAGGYANINSVECNLPDDLTSQDNSEKIASFVDFLSFEIEKTINKKVFVFLEGSRNGNWKKNFKSIINGIEIHNLKEFTSGFKLRTGGVTADAFPSSEQIAFCIRECLDRKVPMKFTAGLHHPFRHFDNSIGTMMHGFINVFGAGVIAMRHNLSDSGIEKILNDENPKNFLFTDDSFTWKGWRIEIADIKFARQNLVLSFGSCSFDEPVDDLKSLNLF